MKKIIEYQCEVCGSKYDNPLRALECEEKGAADTSRLPVGLMYEHHHNGYVGAFAVAKVSKSTYSKHLMSFVSWAVRVQPYPRYSLGDDMCGSGSLLDSSDFSLNNFAKYHKVTKEKIGSPEFKELISYLLSKGITPMYYDENGIINEININEKD